MSPDLFAIFILTSACGLFLVLFGSLIACMIVQTGVSKRRAIVSSSIAPVLAGALMLLLASLDQPPLAWLACTGAAMLVVHCIILGLVFRGHSKRIAAKLAHIEGVSQFGWEHFNSIMEETHGDFIVTAHSLSQALLDRDTTEENREVLSSLRLHLPEFGHKIDDERSYVFLFDKKVQATQITCQVYGASPTDIQNWPAHYRQANASWLPRT